jgi:hypothetical protein
MKKAYYEYKDLTTYPPRILLLSNLQGGDCALGTPMRSHR